MVSERERDVATIIYVYNNIILPHVGDVWSEEALTELDSLTHCVCWKPVMVRVVHRTTSSVAIVDTTTDQVCVHVHMYVHVCMTSL